MEKSLKEFFGTVIKQIRKEKKISQVELAVLCDMERGYISKLERALVQPSLITIYKLADALEVEASHILDRISYLRMLREKPNIVLRDIVIYFQIAENSNWRNIVIYLNRIFDQWKPVKADKQTNDSSRKVFNLTIDNIQRLDLYHNLLSVFLLDGEEYKVNLKLGREDRKISAVNDVKDSDTEFGRFEFIIDKL